jgi:hypothetical protein
MVASGIKEIHSRSRNKPWEFDDELILGGKRGAARGAKAIWIEGRLVIFAPAFTALNTNPPFQFLSFDDFPGFI